MDLLFASSGLEPEIVSAAERLEILPGTTACVATTAHLLALKILAGRPQDLRDARWLLARSLPEDLDAAREALALVADRNFHRGKDLEAAFRELLALGLEQFEG